jgi:diguanylate cyclase (GGDEF)-like protein
MTTPLQDTSGFAAAVIDALTSHVCVVDRDSVIVAVNRAWRDFGAENPPPSDHLGVGTHYLDVCRRASGFGSEEAGPFARGVRAVLKGRTELFQMEYPCPSPSDNRWFLGRVTPLRINRGGAVISHMNITDRKTIEIELAKLAATDPLTGLPNRRYLLEMGNKEFERVRRFSARASVVMIDLDHFKAVNDTYGHAAGDEALHQVSQACKAELRQIDIVARLGGEEFVVVLPGADEAAATIVAEGLRCAVLGTPFGSGVHPFRVTASFGVAQISGTDVTFDASLSRADMALYRAKRAGRNRVENFSSVQALQYQTVTSPTESGEIVV